MTIYIQLLIASFFWGSNVIVMKILLEHIPFLFLAFLRVFISLVFLMIFMLYKKQSFYQSHKSKIVILSFLAIYLNFLFTFIGMKEVKGIDNALINALSPLLSVLLCFCLLSKKLTSREWCAIGLSVFAFLLSIYFHIFSLQNGFYYLFIGMFLYLLSQVLVQRWDLAKDQSLVFYQLLFGAIFLFVHCLIFGQFDISQLRYMSLFQWCLFLTISGLGFAYIQSVYIKSIEKIGAFQTSFFLSLNPIFTYIESIFFLNESFSIIHFISFLLLIISLILINTQKEKKTH